MNDGDYLDNNCDVEAYRFRHLFKGVIDKTIDQKLGASFYIFKNRSVRSLFGDGFDEDRGSKKVLKEEFSEYALFLLKNTISHYITKLRRTNVPDFSIASTIKSSRNLYLEGLKMQGRNYRDLTNVNKRLELYDSVLGKIRTLND